jgi:hypothetical protein
MKWVAPQDAPPGQIRTPEQTVHLNGLDGVVGTGGGKTTTRRDQRGNQQLIKSDRQDKDLFDNH